MASRTDFAPALVSVLVPVLTASAALCVSPVAGAAELDWYGQVNGDWDGSVEDQGLTKTNWSPNFLAQSLLPTLADTVVFGRVAPTNTSLNLGAGFSSGAAEAWFTGSQAFTLQTGFLNALTEGRVDGVDARVFLTNGAVWRTGFNGRLEVGDQGYGLVDLQDSARVETTTVDIGIGPAGTGHARLFGVGARWEQTGTLTVGQRGQGWFDVLAGAQAEVFNAVVGQAAGSSGAVRVNGAGSALDVSVNLSVGVNGTGSLSIENGGRVSSQQTTLGATAGSSGTVTVTGAGSRWDNTADLILPFGRLDVLDGGTVQVGGVLDLQPSAAILINGGTLVLQSDFGAQFKPLDIQDGSLVMDGAILVPQLGNNEAQDEYVLDGEGLPSLVLRNGAEFRWKPRRDPGSITPIIEPVVVGDQRRGLLRIEAGSMADLAEVSIGRTVGASGEVQVVGQDASLEVGSIGVGGRLPLLSGSSTSGGSGLLSVADEGSATTLAVRIFEAGRVDIDGGTLRANGLDNSLGGTLAVNDGTLRI